MDCTFHVPVMLVLTTQPSGTLLSLLFLYNTGYSIGHSPMEILQTSPESLVSDLFYFTKLSNATKCYLHIQTSNFHLTPKPLSNIGLNGSFTNFYTYFSMSRDQIFICQRPVVISFNLMQDWVNMAILWSFLHTLLAYQKLRSNFHQLNDIIYSLAPQAILRFCFIKLSHFMTIKVGKWLQHGCYYCSGGAG